MIGRRIFTRSSKPLDVAELNGNDEHVALVEIKRNGSKESGYQQWNSPSLLRFVEWLTGDCSQQIA
jgi:hypothetical protein